MPILIAMPYRKQMQKAVVAYRGGGIFWLPVEDAQILLDRPWDIAPYAREVPLDHERSNLITRLHVIPPLSHQQNKAQ